MTDIQVKKAENVHNKKDIIFYSAIPNYCDT